MPPGRERQDPEKKISKVQQLLNYMIILKGKYASGVAVSAVGAVTSVGFGLHNPHSIPETV